MDYLTIEKIVREDFESFTNGDVEPIDQWSKSRQIKHATKLAQDYYHAVCNYMPNESWALWVQDFIHGLNHLFFYGMYAGILTAGVLAKKGE